MILTFASEGERDKFTYIYEKYKHRMLNRAQGILRDRALAEDAVSEAFLRIYRNMEKIDDPDSPRCAAFVGTIVRNTALTLLEKEKRVTGDLIDEALPDECDVEAQVLDGISSQEIIRLVDSIGEELRSVFLLRYAYDLSYSEIGKALGISENNVAVRIHRARKKLSAIVAKEGFVGGTR